jgi:signal transduction histidine kinase
MSTDPDRERPRRAPPRGLIMLRESSSRRDALEEQVRARLGVLPNFFSTAHSAPGLTEELWRFARSAYLDSPLPSLFKERLFVHLSRFCANRYCIVRHVGFLVGKGHAAGDFEAPPQRIEEVLALLGRPVPDTQQLQASLALLEKHESAVTLPGSGAALEAALFDALTILFVMPEDAERARLAVTRATGERRFELLTAFLAFVRTAHFWTETHPSLQFEGDTVALLQEHPALARLLLNTSEAEWAHSGLALRRARDELRSAAGALRSTQTRFQALVVATSDVLYLMSPDWSRMRVLDGKGFLAATDNADSNWLQRYVPADEQARVNAATAHAIATGEVFELEHRVRRIDGTEGFVLSRAVPMLDEHGAVTEWFGAAMDLTARRKAADALRDADRRKDEFLAMLAHELRNPLATLRNGLYLAKRMVPADAPLVPTIEMMHRQLAMLVHLVDDLTDVGRISTGKIRIRREPLVVQDVVAASIEASQAAADARGHALRVMLAAERLGVSGDFDRLTQVFSNLLCNAVKYTRRGGRIEVQVTRDAGEAVVSVRDTGIGIPAAEAAGIFDLFAQIPAHQAHANGGLGIGLALVRQLVELHDGTVGVVSGGEGLGSTFTVRLPLSAG